MNRARRRRAKRVRRQRKDNVRCAAEIRNLRAWFAAVTGGRFDGMTHDELMVELGRK